MHMHFFPVSIRRTTYLVMISGLWLSGFQVNSEFVKVLLTESWEYQWGLKIHSLKEKEP